MLYSFQFAWLSSWIQSLFSLCYFFWQNAICCQKDKPCNKITNWLKILISGVENAFLPSVESAMSCLQPVNVDSVLQCQLLPNGRAWLRRRETVTCVRSIWQLSRIFGSVTRTVCGSVFLQGNIVSCEGGGMGDLNDICTKTSKQTNSEIKQKANEWNYHKGCKIVENRWRSLQVALQNDRNMSCRKSLLLWNAKASPVFKCINQIETFNADENLNYCIRRTT